MPKLLVKIKAEFIPIIIAEMLASILLSLSPYSCLRLCADPERGTGGPDPPPPPLMNHKNIGFLSNSGPDPQKNHKANQASIQCYTPSHHRIQVPKVLGAREI